MAIGKQSFAPYAAKRVRRVEKKRRTIVFIYKESNLRNFFSDICSLVIYFPFAKKA